MFSNSPKNFETTQDVVSSDIAQDPRIFHSIEHQSENFVSVHQLLAFDRQALLTHAEAVLNENIFIKSYQKRRTKPKFFF